MLSGLPLVARSTPSKWRHDIRAVDVQGRVRLREAAELDGFDGRIFARLRPNGWELRPAGPAGSSVRLDPQGRLIVPVGIRHQLGIQGTVVVSTDGTRILVWPSSHIDTFLEETQP